MKKNTVLYIIITILLIIIAVGITYIIMDKNDINNNPNENNNQEEQITLSEEELEEYLSYIPKDIINNEQNMYINPRTNDELPIETLLGAALNYADKYTNLRQETEYGDTFLFSKNEINSLMKKMYNKEPVPLEDEIEYNCAIYSEYDNNYYLQSGGCGIGQIHLRKIDSYQATEEELVIYEYAAYLEETEGADYVAIIKDYINDEKAYLGMPCPDTENDFSCYFEESVGDFTLYKHTFKKNDTGYYWYSTEVA